MPYATATRTRADDPRGQRGPQIRADPATRFDHRHGDGGNSNSHACSKNSLPLSVTRAWPVRPSPQERGVELLALTFERAVRPRPHEPDRVVTGAREHLLRDGVGIGSGVALLVVDPVDAVRRAERRIRERDEVGRAGGAFPTGPSWSGQ